MGWKLFKSQLSEYTCTTSNRCWQVLLNEGLYVHSSNKIYFGPPVMWTHLKIFNPSNSQVQNHENYSINWSDVVVLDSSSSEKFSCHLVFPFVFKTSVECKNFVEFIIANLSRAAKKKMTVFNKNNRQHLIIDMNVYHKNQNFRWNLSLLFIVRK